MERDKASAETRHRREGASIVRGMSAALLGSLVGGGFGFLFLVVMARLVEQDEFGLLVLAINVLVTLATLSLAGADSATIYYVAVAETAERKRGAIVTGLKLVVMLNLVLAVVCALFAEEISVHVLNEPSFTQILRVLALALPLTVLAQMLSAGLSGLELARGEFARKAIEQLGRILLGLLAISLGAGLVGVVVGMAAAAAASAAAVGYLLVRALPPGGKEQMRTREMIGFSWPQAVANGARQMWVLANIVILAHFTDARTVALFGAAYAVSRLPMLIYNAFSFRFSPAIARMWNRGDREALRVTLKNVTRWVAMFALPFYAIAIVLPGPLLEAYGGSYREAATALAIMTVATLINSLTGPVERALVMSGQVRLEMATNVVCAIVMVGFAIVLTDQFGLTGAALSALAYTVVLNVAKVYLVWRTMHIISLSRSLLRPLAAAAGPAAAVALVGQATRLGSSLGGAVLLGVALVLSYGFVLSQVVGISAADRTVLRLALRP